MSPQIKYAYKKHNTWIYRRVYPKPLQPLLGTALKQSLKTGDAREAKLRVAELNQTFTTIIKEACLGPLKLCQYLLTNGVAKNGTETVFG
jgi:hypothetical protein